MMLARRGVVTAISEVQKRIAGMFRQEGELYVEAYRIAGVPE